METETYPTNHDQIAELDAHNSSIPEKEMIYVSHVYHPKPMG